MYYQQNVSAAHVNRVEAENYENHVAMAFEGFVVVVLFVLFCFRFQGTHSRFFIKG